MKLDLPFDGGGTRDETNDGGVHAGSSVILEIQVEGIDAGVGALVGLLLVEVRVALLVHVSALGLEDIGTAGNIVGAREAIIASGRVVILQSKLHVALDVVYKITDTEESLVRAWLLEFKPDILVLNRRVFSCLSHDGGTKGITSHSLNLEVSKVLGLDFGLYVEVALLVCVCLLRIFGTLEADQIGWGILPGSIFKNGGLVGAISRGLKSKQI